jgi:hypothetical protein
MALTASLSQPPPPQCGTWPSVLKWAVWSLAGTKAQRLERTWHVPKLQGGWGSQRAKAQSWGSSWRATGSQQGWGGVTEDRVAANTPQPTGRRLFGRPRGCAGGSWGSGRGWQILLEMTKDTSHSGWHGVPGERNGYSPATTPTATPTPTPTLAAGIWCSRHHEEQDDRNDVHPLQARWRTDRHTERQRWR